MGRINMTECGLRYKSNATLQEMYRWPWDKPVIGIGRNNQTQISLQGCLDLCGSGNDYYEWATTSATITTWILPIIGVLLQAPFESNAALSTFLTMARWLGSPMASLSNILWNIKVSGRSAMIVDMASKYDDYPIQDSDFGSFRDSFFILTVMNQYTMRREMSIQKEAEGLLRIVLFSKDLKLLKTKKSLRDIRKILAQELREGRKRGVVPVLASFGWFLFALALSVQSAFGYLGENTTAHDLALGCLLSWLPVLVGATIIDRNPIAADAIKNKINSLINHVRVSLQDPAIRRAFIQTFRHKQEAERERLETWVERIAAYSDSMDDFFVKFAGQGRLRWHYGAAHPILSDIENSYLAGQGRWWLKDEEEARLRLVLGEVDEGLIWFDFRELWQISAAIAVVTSTVFGAFTLSYFTPTVGLGCRSGGYVIFFSICSGLLIVEMLVWWLVSPVHMQQPPWLRRATTATIGRMDSRLYQLRRRASSLMVSFRKTFVGLVRSTVLLFPWKDREAVGLQVEESLHRISRRVRNMSVQRRFEIFFFRPVEAINTIWLIYIVIAQTFGIYHNCRCSCSLWGPGGGYMDFDQSDRTTSKWVRSTWITGTVLSAGNMGIAMAWVVAEWLIQSHLTTEVYAHAMNGLRRTRTYRNMTMPLRRATRFVEDTAINLAVWLFGVFGFTFRPQRSVRWVKEVKQDSSTTTDPEHQPLAGNRQWSLSSEPTIQLGTLSPVHDSPYQAHDTPFPSSSRFPPFSVSPSRSHRESDASSHSPLMHPVRSSFDSPASPPDDRSSLFPPFQRVVYQRQTSSDGGSSSHSRSDVGLGIRREEPSPGREGH